MKRKATQAIFVIFAVLGLAACEDGLNLGSGPAANQSGLESVPATPQTGVRDVERPDIFSTTEAALWDGRPSLGGIWVAHPDVDAPERVIIRNVTNGQSIAGALFRRERSGAGPKLQLSSDAAEALNVLAGQPTEVSVLVVRQEEFDIEPEEPVISEEAIGEDAGVEVETETDGASAAAIGAAAIAATEPAADAAPKGTLFDRLFRRKPAVETPEDASLETAEATAESAGIETVETETLDPVAAGAAAAIARAESSDVTPAPRPEPAPATSTSLQNPFIQVGLFSVETNANSAAATLREAGIVPTVLTGSRGGNSVYRVVVGPVTSADDQSSLLVQVRGLGFDDAFLSPR